MNRRDLLKRLALAPVAAALAMPEAEEQIPDQLLPLDENRAIVMTRALIPPGRTTTIRQPSSEYIEALARRIDADITRHFP